VFRNPVFGDWHHEQGNAGGAEQFSLAPLPRWRANHGANGHCEHHPQQRSQAELKPSGHGDKSTQFGGKRPPLPKTVRQCRSVSPASIWVRLVDEFVKKCTKSHESQTGADRLAQYLNAHSQNGKREIVAVVPIVKGGETKGVQIVVGPNRN
jgi:hypothetical protein